MTIKRIEGGLIIGSRFKILEKLGEGGCGSIYTARDINTGIRVAVKTSENGTDEANILKIEAAVLKRLEGRNNVAQILAEGKKQSFSYIVMTLLGGSFTDLKHKCKTFTSSTLIRISIQILNGIKELHEVGFIHRDIKPDNICIGRKGGALKVIHLLDFGLCREYIITIDGKATLREPRQSKILFRGTPVFCSIDAGNGKEQGRHDDLWSMIVSRDEITAYKIETKDEHLFPGYPEFIEITKYLRTLTYYKRPDYGKIYLVLKTVLTSNGSLFTDPYDWEVKKVYEESMEVDEPDSAFMNQPIQERKSQKSTNKVGNTSTRTIFNFLRSKKVNVSLLPEDLKILDNCYTLENFEKTNMNF
ncbi:Asator [Strongyloides ratti]|uniref:non-specific serine/threonine protein kinase n=1 Tax=Strongyloides ratti TaxID=34506 RepID=A0A090MYI0_STRRB|nr:Asator [Strongyloides ratti]CEF67219.1 Asator [Strongyloides ratti]